MIHLPEHLIGYCIKNSNESVTTESMQIDQAERGPLSYMAGYVIAKLCQLSRKKDAEKSKELLTLLQSLKSKVTNTYISARTRGGLVTPCQDLVNIVEIAEVLFRKQVSQSNLRNIPVEKILNLTLCSPVVKCWIT